MSNDYLTPVGQMIIGTTKDLGLAIDGASGGNGYQVALNYTAWSPVYTDLEFARAISLFEKATNSGITWQLWWRRILPDTATCESSGASPVTVADTWTFTDQAVPGVLIGSCQFGFKNTTSVNSISVRAIART